VCFFQQLEPLSERRLRDILGNLELMGFALIGIRRYISLYLSYA